MIRSYITMLLGVLAPIAASAQDDEPAHKRFEGRLLAGVNMSQVAGSSYSGYHKPGINAGGMVLVHLNEIFSTSMELLYAQKGVRGAHEEYSYAQGEFFDKYYLNLNYAEVDVMLHADGYMMGYEAGLGYAQLIGSKEWAEADVPVLFDPVLCRFNTYDVEYVAGIYRRLNDNWKVNFRLQYSAVTIRPADRVLPRYSDGHNELNNLAFLRLVYTIPSK